MPQLSLEATVKEELDCPTTDDDLCEPEAEQAVFCPNQLKEEKGTCRDCGEDVSRLPQDDLRTHMQIHACRASHTPIQCQQFFHNSLDPSLHQKTRHSSEAGANYLVNCCQTIERDKKLQVVVAKLSKRFIHKLTRPPQRLVQGNGEAQNGSKASSSFSDDPLSIFQSKRPKRSGEPEKPKENTQVKTRVKTKTRPHRKLKRKTIWKCPTCPKCYVRSRDFYSHVETHTAKRYECPCCPKNYSHHLNLKLHMQTHTGKRNFLCSQCGKSFVKKYDLKSHLKLHSQDIAYCCDLCGKSYWMKNSLRHHVAKHLKQMAAKDQVFKCEVCDRQYDRERTLLLHAIVHFGSKPYSCDKCDKTFFRKSSLTRHERNHSPKRFSCSNCGKTFTRRYSVKQHEESCC